MLPVPVSELQHDDVDGGVVKLPYIKIKDFFGFLLKTYPKLLYGGFDLGPEQENLCLQFWQGYRLYHPEHEIYSTFMEDEWKRILPVALHGDKGRTLNKQPIYCFGWETVFGLPLHVRVAAAKAAAPPRHETGGKLNQSCSERAQALHNPEILDDAECPRKRRRTGPSLPYKTSSMPHNLKGHVYLSHWLGTCIPSKVFRAHPGLIDAYLEEVAREMTDLVSRGCAARWFHLPLCGHRGKGRFRVLPRNRRPEPILSEYRNFPWLIPFVRIVGRGFKEFLESTLGTFRVGEALYIVMNHGMCCRFSTAFRLHPPSDPLCIGRMFSILASSDSLRI